jgi:short-subunit dehydrogenase
MKKEYYTLITGASEGLGKAIAIECAKRKMNLVLIALPGIELYALADLLIRNFEIKVLVIEKDLAKEDSCKEIFDLIKEKDLSINILINNAGIGNTQFFEQTYLSIFEKQIRLNILATTSLTHLLIDELKKNSPAYILNVGSLASFFTLPRKQVYGATKSFIYFFSKSLRMELLDKNISVTVICPGGINSNPNQTLLNRTGTWIGKMSLMEPETIAPLAIDGLLRGKAVIIPGRLNRFFILLDKLMPGPIKRTIVRKQMGSLQTK